MKRRAAAKLSIALTGDEPPRELRIFAAGWNDTSKGRFLFDDAAAASVLSAYQQHGADLMFDLEHLSLEDPQASVNFDPDARGWCRLELRNGELWAVDVKWTPDGETRLREKRQRYISPAFNFDRETRRITELVNVAITSLPATHGLEPLVAASAAIGGEERGMTPEQMAAIAEALGLGADANVEDVIAAIGALVKKVTDGIAGEPEGEAAPEAEMTAPAAPVEDEQQKEMAAARASLLRETGASTVLQALSAVADWKASHLRLEQERAKLAKERAALESAERRSIGAALVKAGMPPALVWTDDSAKTLAKALADQPIEALRAYAAKASAQPARTSAGVTPPSTPSGNGLTEREQAFCKARGIDPAKFAEHKAAMAARTVRQSGAPAQEG